MPRFFRSKLIEPVEGYDENESVGVEDGELDHDASTTTETATGSKRPSVAKVFSTAVLCILFFGTGYGVSTAVIQQRSKSAAESTVSLRASLQR